MALKLAAATSLFSSDRIEMKRSAIGNSRMSYGFDSQLEGMMMMIHLFLFEKNRYRRTNVNALKYEKLKDIADTSSFQ